MLGSVRGHHACLCNASTARTKPEPCIVSPELHEGLTIVTNNMREFSRMPGLRAENWI